MLCNPTKSNIKGQMCALLSQCCCCRPRLLPSAKYFAETVKYFCCNLQGLIFCWHSACVPLIVFLDFSRQPQWLSQAQFLAPLLVIYCIDPSKSIVCLDSWPTWYKAAICNPTYNSTGCQNFLRFLARLFTLFVSAIYCLHLKLVMTNWLVTSN